MPLPANPLPSQRDPAYRVRSLSALATSLLLVNGALLFWPNALLPDAPEIRDRTARAPIVLELIEPTRQPPPMTPFPPAPPPPPPITDLSPEEVPDEQIIEELDIPIRAVVPPVPQPAAPSPNAPPAPPAPPPPGPSSPLGANDRIVERPQRSPRIVQTSPPVCPQDVRRDGVSVRARIRVLVSQGGQVQDAEIVERTVTDRRDREQTVDTLPYSLDSAVLAAARRHLFRPARDADQRVRSYTTITVGCTS